MPIFSRRPPSLGRNAVACALFAALLGWLPGSHAALSVSGTRIIYDSDKRNVAVTVSNPSSKAFAVQTWVNTAADDQSTAVPFIASPPLFRLNAGKEQQVQINGLPHDLPSDRESLFFFNVQEIPQIEGNQQNQLNIALRTRIKLFHRPVGLGSPSVEGLHALRWSVRSHDGKAQLRVNNASPYHVSFIHIEVLDKGRVVPLQNTAMALPLSTQDYLLEGVKASPGLQVRFSTINDYGGFTPPITSPVELDL